MTRSNPSLDPSPDAAISSKPVNSNQTDSLSKPKVGSKRKNEDPTGRILQMMKKQIESARYEIEVDPYRGLFDPSGNHRGIFQKCAEVFEGKRTYDSRGNKCDDDSVIIKSDATSDDAACCIPCPCISAWIKEEKLKLEASDKRKNKRRKHVIPRSLTRSQPILLDGCTDVEMKDDVSQVSSIEKDPYQPVKENDSNEEKVADHKEKLHNIDVTRIRRNQHINYSCECDNNPFCLLSIGGVMDEYLQNLIEHPTSFQKAQSWNRHLLVPFTSQWSPTDVYDERFSKFVIPLPNNFVNKISSNGSDSHKDDRDELRAPIVVKKNSVVQYLRSILELSDTEIYDRLQKLDTYYTQLIFPANQLQVNQNEFKICRPVGISNLGATCYLNSQLQCLAANVAFMDGVLRWKDKHGSPNTQMNVVISRLQNLLAHMIHGADNIVSTGDFSSALGLENDEMQDPNEFARLLFDRMHESFQQSSPFLRNLLPNLYQGVFEYHTKCTKCCKVSTRQENFTDLNLPMFVGEEESLSTSINTSVEELLDAYLKAELLDGDNSYYCSECEERISAERHVTFLNLPPVLNIQLARYVFDLKTFRKKKLMDKILLPRTLSIEKNNHERYSYILYAVQNHKGSSAYSGHYITEVMDWSTGVWFEFDDEKVTLRDQGPSSCYDPNKTDRPKEGTSDAYNLFYVDTFFLKETMNASAFIPSVNDDIINQISIERENRFILEKEIQSHQEKAFHRLACRRTGILTFLLQGDCSLGADPVWIAGDIFKRFMSCNDLMDDVFTADNKSSLTVLSNTRYLCEHKKGLHPRLYRTGKLLSKEKYIIFCQLFDAERRHVMQVNHIDPPVESLYDQISAKNHLFCQSCVDDYRAQLRSKLDFASLLVKLYVELDPSHESAALDDIMYAVPKSFATAIRNIAIKLFKHFSLIEVGSSTKCPSSGLDHFDLADWSLSKIDSQDDIDPTVTASLTCPHGNCNMKSKRFIRYVSKDMWLHICKLFPMAHPLISYDGNIMQCSSCENDLDQNASLAADLNAWASKVATDLRSISEVKNELCDFEEDKQFHIIDANDLIAFDNVLNLVRKAKKRGIDNPSIGTKLKYQILGLLFTQFSDDHNEQVYTRRLLNFNCERHKKPVCTVEVLSDLTSRAALDVQLVSTARYNVISSSMKELEDIILPVYHFPLSFVDYHPILSIQGLSEKVPEKLHNLHKLVSDLSQSQRRKVKISWTSKYCLEKDCIDSFSSSLLVANMISSAETTDIFVKRSSTHSDVICVDGMDESKSVVEFHVHEFDGSKSSDEYVSTIMKERLGLGVDEISAPRRSSRNNDKARKSFTLHVKMNYNLAQIRLQVYEKCENKNISNHHLSLLGLTDDGKPLDVELCHDWNHRSMASILKDTPIHLQNESKIELILKCKKTKTQGKSSDENLMESDDSLFDMLVQIATSEDQPQVHAKKGKKRREERGFSGTFLQSSFHASSFDANMTLQNGTSFPQTIDLTDFSP